MQQGQYAQYPKPPVKEIDFGVISEGFSIITKNWLPFVIGALIAMVCMYVPSFMASLLNLGINGPAPANTTDTSEIMAYAMRSQAFSLPFSLLSYALMGPATLTLVMMTLKVCRGELVSTSDLGLGFTKFLPAAIASLCVSFLTMLGVIGCFIGTFLVGGLLMFTLPLIADRDMKPFEAIGESFQMLKKHIWLAGVMYFCYSLLSILGALGCCIGVLLTFPLYSVVPTLIYRDFTMGRGTVATAPAPSGFVPSGYTEPTGPAPEPSEPTTSSEPEGTTEEPQSSDPTDHSSEDTQ